MFRMNAGGQKLDINIVRFAFSQAMAKGYREAYWLVLSERGKIEWENQGQIVNVRFDSNHAETANVAGIPIRIEKQLSDSVAQLIALNGDVVAEITNIGTRPGSIRCPACNEVNSNSTARCQFCNYEFYRNGYDKFPTEELEGPTKLEQIISQKRAEMQAREEQLALRQQYEFVSQQMEYQAQLRQKAIVPMDYVIHGGAKNHAKSAKKSPSHEIEAKPKRKLILE